MKTAQENPYNPAIYILAAGNGSRLYPATRTIPKALLPTSPGRRISHWAFRIARMSRLPIFAGVQKKHVSVFSTAYVHLNVTWLETPPNLESGGSFLHNAQKLLKLGYTHLVVIPADYYIHIDAHELLNRLTDTNSDVCLLASSTYPYFEYLNFRNNKLEIIDTQKTSDISYIGIYAISLNVVPSDLNEHITNTEILNTLIARGHKFATLEHNSYWTDLGTKTRLIHFIYKYNLHRFRNFWLNLLSTAYKDNEMVL